MSTTANSVPIEELLNFLSTKVNRNLKMYFEACQRCGLCAQACHYYQVMKDPKVIPAYKARQVQKLCERRNGWAAKLFPGLFGPRPVTEQDLNTLVETVFGNCTMCRRCTLSCPMGIDIAMIIRAARGMLTKGKKTPKGLQDTVDTHLRAGNNMGISQEDFLDTMQWLEEELQKETGDPQARIPVDQPGANIMFVINPREVKFYPTLLLASAKILYAAGESWTLSSRSWDVTNYALFSGDDAAAQAIARPVVEEFSRLGAKTIVCTECGHGFRALKYLAPGWLKRNDFQVKGFVEVVAKYIEDRRLKLDPSVNKIRVTYHDPCNQARSGGLIEEPRFVIRHSISDFVELEPHGRDNWCCGAGGGALTMGEFRERRLQVSRLKAEQIARTGARIVATSCHNCIDQILELNRHYNLNVQVKNLCELVSETVVLDKKPAPTQVARNAE